MFLKEELGGHGKDQRVIQKVLPLEHIFKVGDRITPITESLGFGRFGIIGTITDVKYDKRKQINWLHILWDDGKSDRHVAGAKTLKIVEQNLPLEHKEKCNTLIYSVESEGLLSPQKLSEGYTPNSSLKLVEMPKPSCDRIGEISQSTQTSETTTVPRDNLIYLQSVSHVQAQVSQEEGKVLTTKLPPSGLRLLDSSVKESQASLLLKTLKGLSLKDYEQCLEDSEWLAIRGTIQKSYRQSHLAHPIEGKEFLSLPTLNASSAAKSRAAGQVRCELWFRQNGLLRDSQCLSPQIMALLLGFPQDWTECLWGLKEGQKEESVVDSYSEAQLSLLAPQSPLEELSTYTKNLDLAKQLKAKLKVFKPSGYAKRHSKSSVAINEDQIIADDLYDQLVSLENEKYKIKSEGVIALVGTWIEYGKISKRKFRQAYYRSRKAIFPAKSRSGLIKSDSGLVKRLYIGEENSKEVQRAGLAIARRNRLEIIEIELKQIEKKLCE